jgi:hypothetical protein
MKELAYTTDLSYESEHKLKTSVSGWIKYGILGLVVVIPIVIFAFAPIRCWGTAIFAYVNCLLYAAFALHFIKKGTLGFLIPVISSGLLLMGTSVPIIYFSIFYPDSVYRTLAGEISYFAGGVKYQLAIFLFLLVYSVSMCLFLRNEKLIPQHPTMVSKYIGYISFALFVLISCLHMYAVTVFGSKTPSLYFTGGGDWAYRLYNHFRALLFAVGVVITRLSWTVKMVLVVFLMLVVAFYSLLSARGGALWPIVSVLGGMFLFSEAKTRTKIILFLVCIMALPWYVLIGNTVRIVLYRARQRSIEERISAMKEWKSVVKRVPVGVNFFGRTFFTAGNLIVACSPAQYPYKHFSPTGYAKEVVISMVPGPVMRFTGLGVSITKMQYTGTWMLRDYGMFVTETTSIETSTIGSLWMLGGYIPVLIGGFFLALIHSLVAWIIRRAWVQNPDKGVFYFSVCFNPIFWSHSLDLIAIWRTVILHLVFAYFGFKLISPFLKMFYVGMKKRHEELALGMY